MQNRRDFLKTATLAALGSGLVVRQTLAGESSLSNVYINKLGLGGKMKMSFFPYELKLKHVFTVATYSRTTTPDVQVEIEYEGITGYGEASMPPYLGETVESVMSFRVELVIVLIRGVHTTDVYIAQSVDKLFITKVNTNVRDSFFTLRSCFTTEKH